MKRPFGAALPLLLFCSIFFAGVLISTPAAAQGSAENTQAAPLSTPRKSLHTFLHWQQKGHQKPELYVRTMKQFSGTDEQRKELAEQLKMVLDARGLLVSYEEVPDNPLYVDSLSGLHQYILFRALPEVYLSKINNEWVFDKETVNRIPGLYRATFSSWVQRAINNLPDWALREWFGIELWQYIGVFVWLFLGLIIRKLFEFFLDSYIRRLAQKTRITWDDALINEVEKPLGLIFLLGFYSVTYTNLKLPVAVTYYLSGTIDIAISVAFIWLAYNLTNVFTEYLSVVTGRTENKLDDQLVPLVRKTLRFFIVVMGVILVLQNSGYNVASLIAGLGIGGLAVALAARDTLANFFGSITIFMDRPFRIGDWVVIGNDEGIIEEVGFRTTRIRTFYNSLVSIPNAKVADTSIDNFGMRKYRRLKAMLNLTYSTTPEQMEAFVEGIKAIVKANNMMRQDYYEVHFNAFGAHSLDVLVYVFFEVPDWSTELQQRHNFLLEVLRLAKKVGVEFAFPTQTLHIDSFNNNTLQKPGTQKSRE